MAAHRVAVPRIVFGIVVVSVMSGCFYGPPYDRLYTGDEELLEFARDAFPDGDDRVAMALIDGDEVRTAFVTADASTMFELGIASRALTGELLAQGIERGEVALDDPVGMHLPLGDSAAGSVTLRDLAIQRSGLPTAPVEAGWMDVERADRDPATGNDLGALLDVVATMPVSDERAYEFSSVQPALLGHALADAAGRGFADLLAERVLEPVGMEDSVLVETTADLPDALAKGHLTTGSVVDPVAAGAYAPAIGLVVTVDDMIALARDVLTGGISDSAAIEPIADTPWTDTRIGYFWEVAERAAGDVTYVVGWSRGFSAALLADIRDEQAVILLRNAGDTTPWDLAVEMLGILED